MAITINDSGQTLSISQRDALTAKAAAYPFDLYIEIQTQYPLSRASFENQIALHVTPGSRVVAIGVDPLKHYTFVRSSAALNVPPGTQVAQAGNVFFKQGNLVDGIDAIAAKAQELRTEPVAAVVVPKAGPDVRVIQSQTGVPIVINEHHTSAGVWWGVATFVVAALAVVGWFVWRGKRRERALREAQEALDLEAAELRTRNIEEQGWHDSMAAKQGSRVAQASSPLPVASPRQIKRSSIPAGRRLSVSPPAAPVVMMPSSPPAPVIIQNGSSGIDTLLAYELGRESSRPAPVIVEREVIVEPSSSSWSSSSDSDSSSSSSWSGSDDSSSSSSFDSGGGSDSSSGSDW